MMKHTFKLKHKVKKIFPYGDVLVPIIPKQETNNQRKMDEIFERLINKPNQTKQDKVIEKVKDLWTFFSVDMYSKFRPEQKIGKDIWHRKDVFKNYKEFREYLEIHFKILKKEIKRLK